jgi:hypothetical protein
MMGWIFHFVVFCEMCHVWRFAPGVWRFAPGVFGASRPVSSASRPSVWRFAPQILTLAPASVKTAFSQPGAQVGEIPRQGLTLPLPCRQPPRHITDADLFNFVAF